MASWSRSLSTKVKKSAAEATTKKATVSKTIKEKPVETPSSDDKAVKKKKKQTPKLDAQGKILKRETHFNTTMLNVLDPLSGIIGSGPITRADAQRKLWEYISTFGRV